LIKLGSSAFKVSLLLQNEADVEGRLHSKPASKIRTPNANTN
jgi:hypothetical protein